MGFQKIGLDDMVSNFEAVSILGSGILSECVLILLGKKLYNFQDFHSLGLLLFKPLLFLYLTFKLYVFGNEGISVGEKKAF